MTPLVVFSDLDDTLLNAITWAADEAAPRPIVDEAGRSIPLVLCSRRTRAEIERIQQQLGFRHPFICEGGSAVFVPRGYFDFDVPNARTIGEYEAVEFGYRYPDVVSALRRTAARLHVDVLGFGDMSVEDVANDCDVPMLQAQLAKLREYREPFRIVAGTRGAQARLVKSLRAAGIGCVEHGRYLHAGATVYHEAGVEVLKHLYARALGPMITVAFGDNVHGAAVLRRVDVPLIVDAHAGATMRRLCDAVPAARIAMVESMSDWAAIIRELAHGAERGPVCPQ